VVASASARKVGEEARKALLRPWFFCFQLMYFFHSFSLPSFFFCSFYSWLVSFPPSLWSEMDVTIFVPDDDLMNSLLIASSGIVFVDTMYHRMRTMTNLTLIYYWRVRLTTLYSASFRNVRPFLMLPFSWTSWALVALRCLSQRPITSVMFSIRGNEKIS